ncbi:histidine kinase [Micromonospora sp. NPDC000668]|uniref:histidine kinase n=1 Tax=Micromonospora sp. NPDC000668 TaxID=3364219 RepID=UPI0036845FCE
MFAAARHRIERDLHDGAQARLVALRMSIGLAEQLLADDPAAAQRLLTEAQEASGHALAELRHLVRGIYPPVLAERGLDGGGASPRPGRAVARGRRRAAAREPAGGGRIRRLLRRRC